MAKKKKPRVPGSSPRPDVSDDDLGDFDPSPETLAVTQGQVDFDQSAADMPFDDDEFSDEENVADEASYEEAEATQEDDPSSGDEFEPVAEEDSEVAVVDTSAKIAGDADAWERELLTHLDAVEAYGAVTVTQFANLIGTQSLKYAKALIDRYFDQGLLGRTWAAAKGRYHLTDNGAVRLKGLRSPGK